MAYMEDIPQRTCQKCTDPATKVLRDRKSKFKGYYCRECGWKALNTLRAKADEAS